MLIVKKIPIKLSQPPTNAERTCHLRGNFKMGCRTKIPVIAMMIPKVIYQKIKAQRSQIDTLSTSVATTKKFNIPIKRPRKAASLMPLTKDALLLIFLSNSVSLLLFPHAR